MIAGERYKTIIRQMELMYGPISDMTLPLAKYLLRMKRHYDFSKDILKGIRDFIKKTKGEANV